MQRADDPLTIIETETKKLEMKQSTDNNRNMGCENDVRTDQIKSDHERNGPVRIKILRNKVARKRRTNKQKWEVTSLLKKRET